MDHQNNYENLFILTKAITEISDTKLRMKILALNNLSKQKVFLEEKMVKEMNSIQKNYQKRFKPFIQKQNSIIEGDLLQKGSNQNEDYKDEEESQNQNNIGIYGYWQNVLYNSESLS